MRNRLFAIFLLVVGLAVPLTPTARADAPDAPDRPRRIGRMDLAVPPNGDASLASAGPGNSRLLVSSTSRRAYQILHEYGATVPRTWVSAYDIDTMTLLGQVSLPYKAAFPGPESIDHVNHRLFIPMYDEGTVRSIAVVDEFSIGPGRTPKVDIVDAPRHPAYASPMTLLVEAGAVAGIRYEPETQKLLLALSPQRQADEAALRGTRGRQTYGTFIAQWDARPGKQFREEWLHLIRECSAGPIGLEVGSGDAPILSADKRAVQLLCGTGETGWQFVKVPLDETGTPLSGPNAPPAMVWPAPNGVQRIVVDPVAQRTHVLAESAYGATFDWTSGRLLGTFAVSQRVYSGNLYPGIDLATGRLYILVPPLPEDASARPELGGLLMVDGRRTPVPQALAFRELVEPAPINPIVVDSAQGDRHRRIFSRAGPNTNQGYPYWDIIEDPLPVSEDPAEGLSDQTADIDEAEGKTERAYAGEAMGYGSRVLVVGGAYRGAMADWGGACAIANRELRMGSVPRSSLTSVGAAARADTIDGDLGTQADVNDTSRCWPQYDRKNIPGWPTPPEAFSEASPGWSAVPAECSGDSTHAEDTGTDSRAPGVRAAATCAQKQEKVDADAVYGALTGPVSIGGSHSAVHMERNDDRGVQSISESFAESVAVEGVGSIALVHAKATTYAKGRTPKAGDPPRSTWTVEVCGVRTATYQQEGCRDPEGAVGALNEAGRGRIVFGRPKADPDLLAGTPKGYLVAVQRDRGEASLALIEHGDDSLIIPGLEVQIRNQAGYQQRDLNRHVVQLAGVRTASVYGISEIPQEFNGVLPPALPVETSIVDGDPVTAGAVGGLVMPPPPNAMPTAPKTGGERVIEILGDAAQVGLRFFRRTLIDSMLMAGIWSTFGLASYLGARRRRITALS